VIQFMIVHNLLYTFSLISRYKGTAGHLRYVLACIGSAKTIAG